MWRLPWLTHGLSLCCYWQWQRSASAPTAAALEQVGCLGPLMLWGRQLLQAQLHLQLQAGPGLLAEMFHAACKLVCSAGL